MTQSYDDSTHRYTSNGKRIPHLTGILSDVGITEGVQFASDHKRWIGQEVHEAIHFFNKSKKADYGFELDWESLDKQIVGYVRAYEDYHNKHIERVIDTEQWLIEPTLQFGGTPDVVCEFKDGKIGVLEVKSGLIAKWVRLQLAGQAWLVKSGLGIESPYMIARRAVSVHEDGTWDCKVFKDPRDIDVFLAAYSISSWVHNKGE